MIVEAQININGSKEAIWAVITNIENAAAFTSGIEKIEIVDKPTIGIVGLRWRETRILFGKPATVEKWITEAVENQYYKTQAEDGGFLFLTTKSLSAEGGSVKLTEAHESKPQGFVSKIMSIPMVLFFKGVIRKALLKDLVDIKAEVEKNG